MTNATLLKEDPYRISSVYYKQLSLGAHFIRDDYGWIRAEHFTEPNDESQKTRASVGLSDISHLAKLSVKTNDVIGGVNKIAGGKLQIRPNNAFIGNSGLFRDEVVCPLTRDEALILSRMSDSGNIITHLEEADIDCFHVTDLTSFFTGFYLIGPKSREVLCKLTEVDVNSDVFPNFAVSQLPLFHVQSILLRYDIQRVLGFQIYFDRGFGEYLWDKIMHAGKEFDISAIGSSALRSLGWQWS
jgi:sarcosine oxidase, subunit alpha